MIYDIQILIHRQKGLLSSEFEWRKTRLCAFYSRLARLLGCDAFLISF